MPTKPSYQSQAELEHRQAGLRGDRHRHLVGDDEAAAPVNSLSARNRRGHLAQRAQVLARCAAARNGKRASVSCQSSSGIARRSSVRARARAARATSARSRRGEPHGRRRRDPAKPSRVRRSTSARGVPRAVEVPVAQHVAHATGRRAAWLAGPVGVAVDQRRAPAPAHPGAARPSASTSTDASGARRARCVARSRARIRARRCARRSASGSASAAALPRRTAHLRAEALVGDVGQAQRVAVRQQHALAERDAARSGRAGAMTPQASSIASPTQEVAIAGHEGDACVGAPPARSTAAQRASKPRCRRVVADPDLEQVAEDEDRVGAACAAGTPPRPRRSRGVLAAQVQVGDEVDRAPASAAPASSRERRAAPEPAAPRDTPRSGHDAGASDHHVLERHVVVAAAVAGASRPRSRRRRRCPRPPCRTRHSPSPAASRRLKLRNSLSVGVDEELRGRRVRRRGARHRHRVLVVLQAVVGLVLDRRAGGLLLHAGLEAAALDHEALDDAVEHRAVVVAVARRRSRKFCDRRRAPWRRRVRRGSCPWLVFSSTSLRSCSLLQGGLS